MATAKQAAVRNAADREQVEKAGQRDRYRNQAERKELAGLLELPAFRNWYWRMLTYCKVFESIADPPDRIHYQAGRQDTGHFLLSELVETDPTALIRMMQHHSTLTATIDSDA